ncbi:prepilin-type N-terminal cleavage/methylation domain-containing protein [Heliobacterium undosum]|uniref:Prepilin-type N-terminal cleavage/methylation domain-containing protein n=1 Tax=Heliomicrobium undosum TaxID=121734 RepID=A0A845L0N6_9FIRM|nr:GspH/FimT family protein [Heliomicrobium undosum]MZP28479.1 prepilin-type N-terminal cleavage/methylation domain-containing protein [Heliomicrobium undosum]
MVSPFKRWMCAGETKEALGVSKGSATLIALRESHGGYTLVEISLVLALLGFLLLATGPILSRWHGQLSLESAARQVQVDLLSARDKAVLEQRTVAVAFTMNSPQYRITYSDDERTNDWRSLPGGVVIQSTSFNLSSLYYRNTFIFTTDGKSGMPTMGGTVMLRGMNGRCRYVIVSRNGRVRIDSMPPPSSEVPS